MVVGGGKGLGGEIKGQLVQLRQVEFEVSKVLKTPCISRWKQDLELRSGCSQSGWLWVVKTMGVDELKEEERGEKRCEEEKLGGPWDGVVGKVGGEFSVLLGNEA